MLKRDLILELLAEGVLPIDVAAHVGCSRQYVSMVMKGPQERRKPRSTNPETIDKVEAAWNAGTPISRIALEMDVPVWVVSEALYVLRSKGRVGYRNNCKGKRLLTQRQDLR